MVGQGPTTGNKNLVPLGIIGSFKLLGLGLGWGKAYPRIWGQSERAIISEFMTNPVYQTINFMKQKFV